MIAKTGGGFGLSPIEIAWTVVGAVVTLLVGVGFTLVGLNPPEFKAARACFIASASFLGGMEVVWYVQTGYSFWWRVAIGTLICLVIGIGLPQSLRWVNVRRLSVPPPGRNGPPSHSAPEKLPTVSPPKQAPPPSKAITKSDGFTILIPIDTAN